MKITRISRNAIKKLRLEQFTAFQKAEFEFVSGVNVFIGANGTGKTHLLKLLYTLLFCNQDEKDLPNTVEKLVRLFRPHDGQLGRLVRRRQGKGKCQVSCLRDGERVSIDFATGEKTRPLKGRWHQVRRPVYIPVKEMLSMAPGFRSIYSQYDTQFEEIYADIIDLAYLPRLRRELDLKQQSLLDDVRNLAEGQIITEGESFFLKNAHGNMEITLVAEGLRKLALLSLLIQNGSLQKGTTLFWDEPEANLNPSMMPHVARVLLTLSKLGVQVFAATHSYSFLKEIELQRGVGDVARYFSLFTSNEQEGVQVAPADTYSAIEPNLIADEYTRIYEMELDKALGGPK